MGARIDMVKFRNSRTYAKVLEHRRKCSKWGKEFCLECFGGGLHMFSENLIEEYDPVYIVGMRK
jgi:hypothetical protein